MNKLRNAAVALLFVITTGAMIESPAFQGQGQARRALPGDLTKSIDQYTGDEFFTLVNRLSYVGGHDRVRNCRGNPGCGNGTLRTNVRIDAVDTEDSLAAGNLPQFGVVAARAIVRGQQTEAMYGMQFTGANGRFTYYLIVTPGTAGVATWRLEELSIQGNTRSHRMLTQGRFNSCTHDYIRGARADFKTCNDPVASTSGQLRFINASFVRSPQGVEPPIWIGCAGGCCTADGGQ